MTQTHPAVQRDLGWLAEFAAQPPAEVVGFPAFAPAISRAEAEGDFPGEAFAPLAEVEGGHFWFETRNTVILWALRRWFPEMGRYLEIGCGTGFVLRAVQAAFPQAQVAGSDLFVEALPVAAGRLDERVPLFQMDARSLPFSGVFDVTGMYDVLEHIDEDGDVLRQVHAALKPGGGLVLTVPQHPFLWSHADAVGMHKRRYTRADLLAKVGAAGFEVVYVSSFITALLPLMLLARRAQRNMAIEDYDPRAEFRLSGTANGLLRAALAPEVALMRGGVSLPFGGSLLVVARKNSEDEGS